MSEALVPVITDEDSGEPVSITEEFRLTARHVHEEIMLRDRETARHMFALGAALKQLRDDRLYLALGFRSFAAYCDGFQMSRQVAYDRIAAVDVLPQLEAPEVVAPVRQISYTNALLLGKAHPDDRKTVAAAHDVSAMSKREVEAALTEAKQARLEAERQRALAIAAEKRATDAQREKAALEEELRTRPTVEVPVVKPDDRAREENSRLREEVAQLKAAQGRLGDLAATEERLRAGIKTLQEQNEALRAERAQLEALQEEAFRVNKGLRELQDVVIRNRGLLETAKAREYGDWIDLQGIYDTETLLQAIIRDLHRITKDCVRR